MNAGVLARIVPVNDAAKTAFNGLARGQEEGLLQEYHNQFIQVEGFAKKEEVIYSSESENDLGSPSSLSSDGLSSIQAELLEGHYCLSLLRPPHLASGVGWRIGKGSARTLDKSVDILVIAPGRGRGFDSTDTRMRRSLASVHAHVQLHRKSGVLILSAGDSHKPVEIFDDDHGDWIRLLHPHSTVLHQPHTRFRLGLLEFALVYPRLQHDRNDSAYKELLQARNDYMKTYLRVPVPHPAIPIVPQSDVHVRDDLRIFRTVGAGGFGCVSAAIDIATGDPFAVKETVIKHRSQVNEIRAEFGIGQCVPEGSEGLVRSTKMFCEHAHPGPCGLMPERVWIVSDLARMDFGSFPSHFLRLPRRQRLNLLKQLLAGLETLHAQGIMHRDISERNCLILSADPAQAGLCDFGKATRTKTSKEPALGPKYTLAPEVDGVRSYDSKIDIWALGLVFYRMMLPGQQVVRLDEHKHDLAMRTLQRAQQRSAADAGLYGLIMEMLAWKATERPTAGEALTAMRELELADGLAPAIAAVTAMQASEPAAKRLKTEASISKEPADADGNVKPEAKAAVPPARLPPQNAAPIGAHSSDIESTQPFTHEIIPRLYPPEP